MFLGLDFFSGKYSMLPQPIVTQEMDKISLNSGTYDHLYISINSTDTVSNINDEWNENTRVNAPYDENLEGGNTAFSLKNTDTVVIKRREKGKTDWVTIFTIPVEKLSDFNFLKEYNYAKSDTEYNFMIISTINGIENSYELLSSTSKFIGICIADKDHFYQTAYNLDSTDITQNTTNSVLTLLNSKYPAVINNADTNYSSGNITALFLQFDENCEPFIGRKQMDYLLEIMNWLTNRKPKILKFDNGVVKLVKITGTPSIVDGGHPDIKRISFDFTEVGDSDSEKDLYWSALSDVEPNRW